VALIVCFCGWLSFVGNRECPGWAFDRGKQHPAAYTKLLPSGNAHQFYFVNEVKSFTTHPSPGRDLHEPRFYEISGLPYSGKGRIPKVMVSGADDGQSGAEAALQ